MQDLIDSHEDLVLAVFQNVARAKGTFHHSTVSRKWSSLAGGEQVAVSIREDALLPELLVPQVPRSFPNCVALRLSRHSLRTLSDELLLRVASENPLLKVLYLPDDVAREGGVITPAGMESFFPLSTSLVSLSIPSVQMHSLSPTVSLLTSLRHLSICFEACEDHPRSPRLPPSLGLLTRLRSLHLSSPKLGSLPDSLTNLVNLRDLHIHDSMLRRIPEFLSSLSSLQSLSLSCCAISIPESLSTLSRLTLLELRSHLLDNIPQWIGSLPCLADFRLETHQTDSLPDSLWCLTRLRSLLLQGNAFRKIPSSIERLQSLESLFLHCRLREVPAAISSLPSLSELQVWGPECSTLGLILPSLSSLTSLHLHGCFRTLKTLHFPGNLPSFPSLRTLFANNMLIPQGSELGEFLQGLESITIKFSTVLTDAKDRGALDLSLCSRLERLHFQGVPRSFPFPSPSLQGSLSSLRHLHFCSSECNEILESIGGLINLEALSILWCPLTSLPLSLGILPRLRSLSLHKLHNLTHLPPTLGSLSSLRTLELVHLEALQGPLSCLTPLGGLRVLTIDHCSAVVDNGCMECLPVGVRELTLQSMRCEADRLGGISRLTQLQRLELKSLHSMERLMECMAGMTSLRCLVLEDLPLKGSLRPLTFLTRLVELSVQHCYSLDEVPAELLHLPLLSERSRSEVREAAEHLQQQREYRDMIERMEAEREALRELEGEEV